MGKRIQTAKNRSTYAFEPRNKTLKCPGCGKALNFKPSEGDYYDADAQCCGHTFTLTPVRATLTIQQDSEED